MKDDTWLIGRRRSDGAKADQKSIGSVSKMAKGKARCRKATGENQKPESRNRLGAFSFPPGNELLLSLRPRQSVRDASDLQPAGNLQRLQIDDRQVIVR